MNDESLLPVPAIVPEMCYRDASAAIGFLSLAFGFTPGVSVPGDGDSVLHAELWAGSGCVMVASIADDNPWSFRVPAECGGVSTGAPYLAVSDIDALYARARSAGATIVAELGATDYGSRDFSARDPEGFLWHFGTYRPRDPDTTGTQTEPELCAGMRYDDARAAIAWLGRAFGFRENFIVPGAGDDIAHAQLELSGDLLMLGSSRTDRFAMTTPRTLGGYTHTTNVWVSDPDGHYDRACAAGAEILEPLGNTPYGARSYVARDPEGFIWSFGSYRAARPRLDRLAAT